MGQTWGLGWMGGAPMPIRPELRRRYPADWKLRSRFVRFYRAKNRCEWCGAANHQPHPVTGSEVVLTVAHVYDRRPENSSLLNLAALCQRCHNRYDARDRLANRRLRQRLAKLAAGQLPLVLEGCRCRTVPNQPERRKQ